MMTHRIKAKNRLGIYLPAFFIGLISSVTLKTIACLRNVTDYTGGYFHNKPFTTAANITLSVFMIFLLSHALFGSKKETLPKESFLGAGTYVPLGALATAVLFLVFDIFKEVIAGGSGLPFAIDIICILLGIGAVIAFALDLIIAKRISELRGYFSVAAALFFAFCGISVYFESRLPANSPERLLTQFALLFSAVFFIYEARISIGRSKWHYFAAFGMSAALILSYTAIPEIIVYASKGVLISHDAITMILILMLALFITMRVIMIAYAPEDEICELAESVIDMKNSRKIEISEAGSNARAHISNLNVENETPSNE